MRKITDNAAKMIETLSSQQTRKPVILLNRSSAAYWVSRTRVPKGMPLSLRNENASCSAAGYKIKNYNRLSFMIAIDNKLISDQVVEEQFVCDLDKCKGGCCEDGDAGAPLQKDELEELIANYEMLKPYLTAAGIASIEKMGKYVYDSSFGWVTPTIKGEMCAYGFRDEKGILKCGIEQAYYDGKISWKKPISCHLFPIKIQQSKEDPDLEYVNYEPRQDLCKAACKLGARLKVPVYIFLKEAIVRKYGEEFYETLAATAEHMDAAK